MRPPLPLKSAFSKHVVVFRNITRGGARSKTFTSYAIKSIAILFFVGFLFLGFSKSAHAANNCSLTASGNWNAAGTWTSCGGLIPQAGDSVTVGSNAFNLVVNAATNNLAAFDMTGYTGTLSGSSNISITPTSTPVAVTLAGTSTWTGTLNLYPRSGDTINLTTGGVLLTGIYINAATNDTGKVVLQDNLKTSAAVGDTVVILQGTLDLNGKTLSGNSVTNRLLIQASTLGTPKTIKVNGGTFANADFQDINFDNGGSNLNLSAITGLSGDCGGNGVTGGGTLTFTATTSQTWAGTAGVNWSANAWTSHVPLPQDDVIINAAFSANQTVTVDEPRLADC
jgi:hypothetical protein